MKREQGLGFFIKLSAPFTGRMVLGLLATLLTLACGLGLGSVSGWFLSASAVAGLSAVTAQAFNVLTPSSAIRFFSLTRTLSRWWERVVTHDATFRILGRLRTWLFERLSGLSGRQRAELHSADILNRLTKDIDLLDRLYLGLLLPTGAALLTLGTVAALVGGLAAVLAIPVLFLLVSAVVVLPFAAYRSGWQLGQTLVDDRNHLRAALLDLVDGLDGLVSHRASWELARRRVAEVDQRRLESELRFQRRGAALRALLFFVTGLAVWALIGLAALNPGASVQGPVLVGLVLLVLGTLEALQALPQAWLELAVVATAAQRVSDLAGQTPTLSFAETPAGAAPQGFDLQLKNLSFAYDQGPPVLSSLSLSLPQGTHLAIVGSSGCGKSTLAALLSGMEPASPGTLRWGGLDIPAFEEPVFRSLVAATTQEPWTLTATLAENLRLAAPEASDQQLFDVLDAVGLGAKVRSWRDGLNTWIEEGGASLSGGERRRVCVARTLLRRCPVTILDEPSEGLDDLAAEALVAAVREHCRGKTLVWISHRPHGLNAFDHVLRLRTTEDR